MYNLVNGIQATRFQKREKDKQREIKIAEGLSLLKSKKLSVKTFLERMARDENCKFTKTFFARYYFLVI